MADRKPRRLRISTFDTNVYSRSKYPVYQRAWMKSDVKEITPKGDYSASHYPDGTAPSDVDMNLGYWSHVYNKVDESYDPQMEPSVVSLSRRVMRSCQRDLQMV